MAEALDNTPYQSLYRRFRPTTFSEIRGQDHVVLALRNAVRDGRVAHAYLFSGPRGTGKTTTARVLAKSLNCTDLRDGEPCGICPSCVEITRGTSLDVHELDAASNNGVEAMRDLVSRAALGTPGRQKVYIVDEVHMLSTPASNALLKTLEEPPAHVVFVLATTDPQKVLPTIRSRTQHYEFRLLGPDVLGDLLASVREQAGLEVPDEALDLAVRRGRGSARDALSVLDQVVASETVEDDLPELDEIVEALADQDAERALVALAQLSGAGYGPQQLAGDLVDHLRQRFLTLVAPELVAVTEAEREAHRAQAERVGRATLVRAMEELGQAQVAMRDAPDPRVNLEVALIRLTHPEADDSPAALLLRIERLESRLRDGDGTVATPSSSAGGTGGAPDRIVRAGSSAIRERAREMVEPAAAESSAAESPAAEPPAVEPPPTGEESAPATGGVGPDSPALGAVRRRSSAVAGRETSDAAATTEKGAGAPAHSEPPVSGRRSAAAAEATASAGDDVSGQPFPSRDALVQAWGDHVISGLRPKAKALFQAGRFVGVEDDHAVFGLPNETHRTRCEEMRAEVESALGDHFGRPVSLQLIVEQGADPAGDPPRPPPRPAQPDRHGGRARSAPDRGSEPAPAPPDEEDVTIFDESELGEVVDVDTSAEARLLEAFPGAEEVR